jgi:phosphohistidine phosphatase
MKRLLLLRHAKAEQAGKDSSDDFARRLTDRGRRDAARMGAFLHENGYAPDLVLCSVSARTRETWQLVAEELGTAPAAQFLKPLYLAPAKTILTALQNTDGAAQTLLMIGHNPGMEDTAASLARVPADKNERARLEAVKDKFPTAALAVLDFDAEQWRDAKPGSGTLAVFLRPKDL